MNLAEHLSIHVYFSILAGLIAWYFSKEGKLSILAGLIAGVAIDFDHLIDYYLAFGTQFRLDFFLNGYQFLKSDKMFILLHAWEYGIILLALSYYLRKKKALQALCLGLALGLLFHLSTDVLINEIPIRSYSILVRARNNFNLAQLVYPYHWRNHLESKKHISL